MESTTKNHKLKWTFDLDKSIQKTTEEALKGPFGAK